MKLRSFWLDDGTKHRLYQTQHFGPAVIAQRLTRPEGAAQPAHCQEWFQHHGRGQLH